MVAGVLQDLEVEAAVLVDRADELKVPRVGLNETATGHFQLRPHTGLNDELRVRPLEAVALDKLDTSPSSGMTGDRPAAVGERHRLVEAERDPGVALVAVADDDVSDLDGDARAAEGREIDRVVDPVGKPAAADAATGETISTPAASRAAVIMRRIAPFLLGPPTLPHARPRDKSATKTNVLRFLTFPSEREDEEAAPPRTQTATALSKN